MFKPKDKKTYSRLEVGKFNIAYNSTIQSKKMLNTIFMF